MAGSGDDIPPADGGEFLLSLLQRTPQNRTASQATTSQPPHQQPLPLDPAVAALGPSINFSPWSSNGSDLLYPSPSPPPWPQQSLSSPIPPNFLGFQHPRSPFPPHRNQFPGNQFAVNQFPNSQSHGNHGLIDELMKLGLYGDNSVAESTLRSLAPQQDIKLKFGSFSPKEAHMLPVFLNGTSSENSKREVGFGHGSQNGLHRNHVALTPPNSSGNSISNVNVHAFRHGNLDSRDQERREGGWGKGHISGDSRSTSSSEIRQPPPGFPSKPKGVGNWDLGNSRGRGSVDVVDMKKSGFDELGYEDNKVFKFSGEDRHGRLGLSGQLDRPGPPSGSYLHAVPASDSEESMLNLHSEVIEGGGGFKYSGGLEIRKLEDSANKSLIREVDEAEEQLVDSLLHEDELEEKNDPKHHRREKDSRGHQLLTQRMRFFKRQMQCRSDIDRLNAPFLAIYQSLVPAEEEKAKQKQLMALLENLVTREWPKSRLFLYGSCANSFGVSKSDVDVCLALEDVDMDKSEVILKLAEIFQTENLQNVQALTRARVPIVKLMDPVTELSCDICINNVLAVVNTKLLRDYAQIDVRLRQLAFIVKHWAKSRGVNATYQGTLSSYAYVLMCIHFLQQRRPAILPCLQEMVPTYSVTVDDVRCTYFDQVDKLHDFGSHNKEPISRLVWAFFNYWAYGHDYANNVISVRTGSIISKREKDWTRRIGNDRHLICIEDPFETSHDLGRVVDKYSIRVLREELERAADILQYDLNPCGKLLEPYLPNPIPS